MERDQTAKADNGKLMLELIPPETYIALGEILTYGANKYAPENWKTVKPDRYIGALLRHLTAYMQNPNSIDEESGYSHIKHVLCNATFLEWFVSQTGETE